MSLSSLSKTYEPTLKEPRKACTLGEAISAVRDAESPEVTVIQKMDFLVDECVTFHQGNESWHDGEGWYYTYKDYPDEGSCGAFTTEDEAREHAKAALSG